MLLRPFHLVLTALCCAASSAWALTTVDIAYLEETRPPVATLANLEPPPADLGRAGVELGIRDNDSTGKFLQQRFQLFRFPGSQLFRGVKGLGGIALQSDRYDIHNSSSQFTAPYRCVQERKSTAKIAK